MFKVNNKDTRMTPAVSFLDTCICYFLKKAILKNVMVERRFLQFSMCIYCCCLTCLTFFIFHDFLVSLAMWSIAIIFKVVCIFLMMFFFSFLNILLIILERAIKTVLIFNKKTVVKTSSIPNSKTPPWTLVELCIDFLLRNVS